MKERRTIEHLAPWLGLVAAGLGWGLSHQVGSNAVFDDCRDAGNLFVLVTCLVGLLIIAAGGYFSFNVWRRGGEESEGRRFVGLLGAILALLAAFAVLLQALSAAILPRCLA
jgi:hypothetical protein